MSTARGLMIVLAALVAAGAGASGTGEGSAMGPVTAIDLGGLDTRSAALMLSAQDAGDLDVSALAVPLPAAAEGRQPRVTLMIDADGASLLEAVAETAPELITEVYAYALDSEGALAATLTQAFRLSLTRHRERLAASGFKFLGDLELAPGDYSLRVLVLQRSSGRLSLKILPLTVPSWKNDTVLLPPMRRERVGHSIMVHAAGTVPAFPWVTQGEAWLPSARQSLDADTDADILLLGRGLGPGLRGDLLDADRQPLAEVGLGDLRPLTGNAPGIETLAGTLDGAALEAGEYRLRVSMTGSDLSADSMPWTVRAIGNIAVAESEGLSPLEQRGRQAMLERYEELRDAYRQTLERLAAGERAAALEPMMQIENVRIGTGAVGEATRLARAQVEIAREFSRSEPDRLLTIIWIHEALYRRHHRKKRYLLATHSRQLVSALTTLYLERDPSPRARHLVASAMVSLAGYLEETGSRMAAANAYHDAMVYDPNHPAALLGLAAIQEFYGQYEAAADLLQRLHKERPEDTQARLRLGINLRRLDKERRAMPHLEAALSEPGPEWVAAVAAQELAELHAGNKRLDESLKVLEEAVVRHPDVQRLKIQHAALLDRAGRRADALAVLDRLDPSVGSDVSSPRLIYSRANRSAIAAVRQALAEEAKRKMSALASSVGPSTSPSSPTVAGTPGGGPE